MKFDVVVGNPPFQEADPGHGASSAPIYQHFLRQARNLMPTTIAMIIPSRWFSGGKGLDVFRAEMLSDRHLAIIDDYPDASSVFPNVQIKGGVCVAIIRLDEKVGKLKVVSNLPEKPPKISQRSSADLLRDVFIRFEAGLSVLDKVETAGQGQSVGKFDNFSDLVSPRNPFGIAATDIFGRDNSDTTFLLYHRGGVGAIGSSFVPRGHDLIGRWKVFIPRLASGSDHFPHPILGKAIIGEPNAVCTDSYLAIGPFSSEAEARNVVSYSRTRFFRFLCLLRKSSQDVSRKVYKYVPMQDFSITWTDEALYEKYGIEPQEILEIQELVSEAPQEAS